MCYHFSRTLQSISLVLFLVMIFGACDKESISPVNQELAFIKYYGHVAGQTGKDIARTVDGGYIVVGSTNSYTDRAESDIFVVKTDSLGNEMWSRSLGRPDANGSGSLLGSYVRYDEEGVGVVVLPDEMGYTIVGNRTYVEYESSSSTTKIQDRWTKVVFYQLDLEGAELVAANGVEISPNIEVSDYASDLKIDTFDGVLNYVITGYTKSVSNNKPPDPNNLAFDITDIFTAKLDMTFNLLWTQDALAYGFPGEDYGSSVHVLEDAYIVTGTVQEQENFPGSWHTKIIAVRMDKSNGGPISPYYFGNSDHNLINAYSIYDPNNDILTIASAMDLTSSSNTFRGHAVLIQVNASNYAFTNYTKDDAINGFKVFQPASSDFQSNNYKSMGIDLLPNNEGFIISMNNHKSDNEENISIMKVDSELEYNWVYHAGYENSDAAFGTIDQAGSIIAVKDLIPGTNSYTLNGYACVGTIALGTSGSNDMMSLIKLNANGNFTP